MFKTILKWIVLVSIISLLIWKLPTEEQYFKKVDSVPIIQVLYAIMMSDSDGEVILRSTIKAYTSCSNYFVLRYCVTDIDDTLMKKIVGIGTLGTYFIYQKGLGLIEAICAIGFVKGEEQF